ncbi:hypothetical protein M011DRAFT_134972 [Sporormia fimetaria CBS 119925]|uniref:Uncharacterized protein n=1 Tax=Sporormia fimetaria CBS 119925 TaxID=1340428 RepID=A0A6A6V5N5_9PLEO|nr:hypothetical protein M011DRAFT_134972 [Sporormia fimetaria CBS 119925]
MSCRSSSSTTIYLKSRSYAQVARSFARVDSTEHTEHCCSVRHAAKPSQVMRAFSSHVTVPRVEVSHLCFSMPFAPHLRSSASRLPGILVCS